MPSLVATTSALARKPCVSTHYVRTNNTKFSGHYVRQRTHNVRAHTLRSEQQKVPDSLFNKSYFYFIIFLIWLTFVKYDLIKEPIFFLTI